jgi:hypothetical protein
VLQSERSGNILLPNGQIVDRSRLATHIRRRFQGSGVAVGQGTAHTPQLQVRAVRPPTTLYMSETVFFSVRNYLLGEYQGKITTAEQLDALRQNNTGSAKWSRFTYAVKAALNQDKLNQTLLLMRQAPGELKDLVEERPVNLVSQIFMFLAHVTRRPLSDDSQGRQFLVVIRALLSYGESLLAARAVGASRGQQQPQLPQDHPLRQLLRALALALPYLGAHDLGQLAVQAWKLSLSTWDGIVTLPETTSALGEWMNFSAVGGLGGLPPDFGATIEQTLRNLEARHGERDARCIKALWMHAEYLSTVDEDRGRDRLLNDRTRDIFHEVLRRGAKGPPRLVAYRYMADAHRVRGERGAAEENMRASIHVMREAFGDAEPMVVSYVAELEAWLTEWGEADKAMQVGLWREELQNAVDKRG